MALPDWQSGEYATNYTEFLLPPSKGSHPTNSSMGILVLSEIGFIIADNLTTPSTPSYGTSHLYECFIAQILTDKTSKGCNATNSMELGLIDAFDASHTQ